MTTLFQLVEANKAAIDALAVTVAAIPSPTDQTAAIDAVKAEVDALAALVGTPSTLSA